MTQTQARQQWMSLLAKAPPADLARLWAAFGDAPAYSFLRAPEAGGVMVQGRAGATGAPFNLGEMTVTRCSIKLETGEIGHAYVQGRDKDHATRAAQIDAMMQGAQAEALRAAVLEPLQEKMQSTRATRSAKAAATRVEFFTMVRGED